MQAATVILSTEATPFNTSGAIGLRTPCVTCSKMTTTNTRAAAAAQPVIQNPAFVVIRFLRSFSAGRGCVNVTLRDSILRVVGGERIGGHIRISRETRRRKQVSSSDYNTKKESRLVY